MPNSNGISFFTDNAGDDKNSLNVIDFETKNLNNIPIEEHATSSLMWAPDGKHFAYVLKNPKNNFKQLAIQLYESKFQPKALILDQISKKGGYAWSPLSDAIALVGKSDPNSIMLVNIKSDERKKIALEGEVGIISWSKKNDFLLAAVRANNHEFENLVLINSKTYAVTEIPNSGGGMISSATFTPDQKFIIYSRISSGEIYLRIVRTKDFSALNFANEKGLNSLLGFAKDDRFFYVLNSKNNVPSREMKIYDIRSGKNDIILQFPHSANNCIPEEIYLANDDKNKFPSYLWRAEKNEIPNRALLIMVHGGPRLQYYKFCNADVSIALKNGLDVLQINYHGSSGYGRTFEQQAFLAKDDISIALNYAVNKLNYPVEKIALIAHSYGTIPSVEAVSMNPNNIELLVLLSPLHYLDGHGTKPKNVLAYHGINDYLDPTGNALTRLQSYWGETSSKTSKKPEWWKVIPDEGHTFHQTETWSNIFSEIALRLKSNKGN